MSLLATLPDSGKPAADALLAGFGRGLANALRAERPDLAWEVTVGPVDRAKLRRLESGGDELLPLPPKRERSPHRRGT